MLRNIITACALFVFVDVAYADTDGWKQLAEKTGAFSPHVNNCSSSEVFLAVGAGNLGICMEKNERSALSWYAAKIDCADDGMRLPEPAEYQQACFNPPSGLVDMTGSYEWASNDSIPFIDARNGVYGAASIVGGGSGCDDMAYDYTGTNTNTAHTEKYRCVR